MAPTWAVPGLFAFTLTRIIKHKNFSVRFLPESIKPKRDPFYEMKFIKIAQCRKKRWGTL